MTKRIIVALTVEAPESMKDASIAALVQQMIDVGQADAIESSEDPGIENPDAGEAAELTILANQAFPVAPGAELDDPNALPKARIVVGAESAYAAISEPHYSLDVRLPHGCSASDGLRRRAAELRCEAADTLKRAARMDRAAMALETNASAAKEAA
jgi:hypothetical protein